MTIALLLPGYRASDDAKSDSWLPLKSAQFFNGHGPGGRNEVFCSMDASSASAVSFIFQSSAQGRRFAKAVLSLANGEDKVVYALTDATIPSVSVNRDRPVEFSLAFVHIGAGSGSKHMDSHRPGREYQSVY